jgi:hypothetical protein
VIVADPKTVRRNDSQNEEHLSEERGTNTCFEQGEVFSHRGVHRALFLFSDADASFVKSRIFSAFVEIELLIDSFSFLMTRPQSQSNWFQLWASYPRTK